MRGHTPGPWGFAEKLSGSENHKGFSLYGTKSSKTRWIGDVSPVNDNNGDPTPEGWANVRLIAAAPEMYEALRKTLEERHEALTAQLQRGSHRIDKIYRIARQLGRFGIALVKAEGL